MPNPAHAWSKARPTLIWQPMPPPWSSPQPSSFFSSPHPPGPFLETLPDPTWQALLICLSSNSFLYLRNFPAPPPYFRNGGPGLLVCVCTLVCSGCPNKMPSTWEHKQRAFISHGSGACEPKMSVPACSGSGEGLTLGLQTATFSPCSRGLFSPHVRGERSLSSFS